MRKSIVNTAFLRAHSRPWRSLDLEAQVLHFTNKQLELGEAAAESLQNSIPLGRLGEPDDVAGLVRFLVGPEARYITGQVIGVDGLRVADSES